MRSLSSRGRTTAARTIYARNLRTRPRLWGLVHPLPCVDFTITVTDLRNHGWHGATRMVRSPLLTFGFGMCCAVFAASMVGGSAFGWRPHS